MKRCETMLASVTSRRMVLKSGRASRTVVFVWQGRAAANGRLAVGRFSDPVAEHLLREDKLGPVRAAREDGVGTTRR